MIYETVNGRNGEAVILYWSAIARYCIGERQQADALQEVDVSLRHHFNHV